MKKAARIVNIVLAVLMLALLVLQFLPYWTVGDKQVSIQEYIWWPLDNKDLTKEFTALYGKSFDLSVVNGMPLIVFFFTVIGVVFTVLKNKESWISIFATVCGVGAIYGYLAKPAFQLNPIWPAHLALGIVITLVSIFPLYVFIRELIFKKVIKN